MNEAHIPEHYSPIKTPKQLVTVAVLAFVVPVLLIVFIAKLAIGGLNVDKNNLNFSEQATATRLKPVGEVHIGTPPPAPAPVAAVAASDAKAAPASGDKVFQANCIACHGAGLMGAPKLGDKAAWSARIAQGAATLRDHALKGIRAMPARGGNSALSDADVTAAVDYMMAQSK